MVEELLKGSSSAPGEEHVICCVERRASVRIVPAALCARERQLARVHVAGGVAALVEAVQVRSGIPNQKRISLFTKVNTLRVLCQGLCALLKRSTLSVPLLHAAPHPRLYQPGGDGGRASSFVGGRRRLVLQ